MSVNKQIGETLARLHTIPTGHLPNKRNWLRSDYLPKALELVKLYASKHERVQELIAYYDTLPQHFPGEDVIIHGDLHPDNTLFADGKLVAFIDWEEVGIGKALLDFGITVLGCCNPKYQQGTDAFFALYNSYTAIRPFSKEEERALESAVRYAAFTAAVWRFLNAHHYYPNEARKDKYLLFWETGLDKWKRPI